MSHSNDISAAALDSVSGGNGINFDQSPAGAIQQVNTRIATCHALEAESKRLSRQLTDREKSNAHTFAAQARQCWDSLLK